MTSPASLDDVDRHFLWDRVFDSVRVSGLIASESAVPDGEGGVWIATLDPVRIVHVSASGELLANESLPNSLLPSGESTFVEIRLAAPAPGRIAVLADYSHSSGKTIFFDGAKLALLGADGHLVVVKQIVKGGRWYRGFVSLANGDVLIMGDQAPLTLTATTLTGDVRWTKTFPKTWVLPSGASFKDGSVCLASPEYASPVIHVLRLTGKGSVSHSATIAARSADVAAGRDGECLVLFDTESKLAKSQFFLTSFGRDFRRRWTKATGVSASQGGAFELTALSDGVLVTADEGHYDATFLAKYDLSGNILWRLRDTPRRISSHAIASGDGFFIVSSGGSGNQSLRVSFGR